MPSDLFPPPTPFVGRSSELDALASHLLPESAIGLASVHGPAGVGKTALVSEFAYRHIAEFPAGVNHPPSFDLATPEEASRAAEVTADHFEPQSRALVVMEEADAGDPSAVGAFVQTLRRKRPRTRFILTSRRSMTLSNEWFHLAIEGLPDPALEALLRDQNFEDDDFHALLARANGNPLLALTIAAYARQGMGLQHLLARLDPATYSGLLGPDGRPLGPTAQPPPLISAHLRLANTDLLKRIRQDPDQVYGLSSREFEEFVAALYEKHGFEVELTPASRDGGVDLYAVKYEPFGKVLTIVECKRNAPHRPVGVEMVRSLHGVVDDKGASVGVLATTSSFTAGAREFQHRHRFRLALQDWFDLQDMLGSSSPERTLP